MSEKEKDKGVFWKKDESKTDSTEDNKTIDVTEDSKKAAAALKVRTPVKKVEHTQDEIERNKDILLGLGFYKKANGGDKVQYITKEGDITIGRTFSNDYPAGKNWAMREGDLPANEKFLKDAEVKKLKVVQAFYDVRDKGGDISKYAPTEPKNTIAKHGTRQVTREIGVKSHVAKGGYYRVRGHEEPDAWMVQQWANGEGISTEVVTAEQTATEAKVVVRAIKNGQYVDAVVIHEFTTTREVVTFETIDNMRKEQKNPIVGYEDDGKPILSDEAKYRIYKNYIKFKNFAIRDATTKAGRIAILKLMNRDWRDPEEIEAETAEVRSVNEGWGEMP